MLHHLVKSRFQLIDATEFLQEIFQWQEQLIGLGDARLLAREELFPTPPLPTLALVLFLVLYQSQQQTPGKTLARLTSGTASGSFMVHLANSVT